jgi:hypothetical protein
MPALSWSTKKVVGVSSWSSLVKSAICRIRCTWRRMAHSMAKRPRKEAGTSVLPRTRTSRVPFRQGQVSAALSVHKRWVAVRGSGGLPSRASSKQCRGSQCAVKMVTVWPRSCSATAASTTRRSAPPMPRSGWKKTVCCFVCAMAAVYRACNVSSTCTVVRVAQYHMCCKLVLAIPHQAVAAGACLTGER